MLNVYNNCNHNVAIDTVTAYLTHTFPDNHIPNDRHIIMAGDFNRHHSWWEDKGNTHLTSSKAMIQPLLDMIHQFDLRMAFSPNIPTLQALSTRNWTFLDNVWYVNHTSNLFMQCDTDPGLHGPNTDHLPLLSMLNLPPTHNTPKMTHNFCTMDWKDFMAHLTTLLPHSKLKKLTLLTEFRPALDVINIVLQLTIEAKVLVNKPFPHTKRWWMHKLDDLHKKKNHLANILHCWRGLPDHSSYQEHHEASKEYAKKIKSTKKEHWENWLLNALERDIWTANKYATDPSTDGGKM